MEGGQERDDERARRPRARARRLLLSHGQPLGSGVLQRGRLYAYGTRT